MNVETDNKIVTIKAEITKQLGDAETFKSLMETTFKGLEAQSAKRALLEGMLRGFTFQNFLQRDVYAIPFSNGYNLITSIDFARKIGARSGIVGVKAPIYVEEKGKVVSCSVTVQKRVSGYVGDYTAEVYFNEYYKAGKNGYPSLWDSKPRTMIAKVAEMHALRKACPEELAQSYVEEEIQRDVREARETIVIDITPYEEALRATKTEDDLQRVWADIPGDAKTTLKPVLEEMKKLMRDE